METNPIDAQGLNISPEPTRQTTTNQTAPVKTQVQPQQDRAERELTMDETREIVASLEGYMGALKTNIGFIVDKEREQIFVTVTNRETNEIIRQIPPEELVVLQEKMKELTGLIFNEAV